MRILIIYATHGGVTRTCAEMLSDKVRNHHTVTLLDVHQSLPSPSDFDAVILGSPIRMGSMNKKLKQYINQYAELLSEIPSAVFLCCGYPLQFEEYISSQIPKKLSCSLGIHCFGGELKPEKLKGFDKLIVKLARNAIQTQDFEEAADKLHELPEILPENIALLAEKIKALS